MVTKSTKGIIASESEHLCAGKVVQVARKRKNQVLGVPGSVRGVGGMAAAVEVVGAEAQGSWTLQVVLALREAEFPEVEG
jgi:hypothetical protein